MRKNTTRIIASGFILLTFLTFCAAAVYASDKKFIIIGIDGMDYTLLNRMLEMGEMPNFATLREEGDFKPLATSIPPQSPVAWSNVITGMDPGGHGIFDFIHRSPEEFLPYLSTTRTTPPSDILSIGKYRIPLKSEQIELLRKGRPFWEILEEHGVPATIVSIPSNFPPVKNAGRSLSGMGTPDLLGSYGSFTFLTSDPEDKDKEVTGGVIHFIDTNDGYAESFIPGPANSLVEGKPSTRVDIRAYIDPERDVAKIIVQGNEILLAAGEWSEFVNVKFEMIPWVVNVSGIVRFYLKEVHPHFKLYVSPVNIDPSDPAMPITSPEDYAKELYENIGYFYTQGMAEDTKALDNGILSEDDFLKQVGIILDERLKILDYELNRFQKGVLFFYFSTIDLSSHMFWRFITPDHPGYDREEFNKYHNVMYDLYRKMDDALGKVLNYKDDNTVLMVMSDHGFKDFRRQVNINSWLAKEGYEKLLSDWSADDEFFASVDWTDTKAYALGINGVYINQRGRERNGIVEPGPEYKLLVDELAAKMEAMTDPVSGERVIRKAYKKYETYRGPYTDVAPDIIVGFYRGYRSSDESALGKFSKDIFMDNPRKWSGDHCMDYREVPGILVINRKVKLQDPALYDIAPTVLHEFGIEVPPEMIGKPIY
jgi:predicted AlkP superfamily phosphohydrolase/phosphomutase